MFDLFKNKKLKSEIKYEIHTYDLISSPSIPNASIWSSETSEQKAERIRIERDKKLQEIFEDEYKQLKNN